MATKTKTEGLSAYLGKDNVLTDWEGKPVGTYKIISSWATPKSYVSSRMYQIEAIVKGKKYTGRSAGVGMLFNGRLKK